MSLHLEKLLKNAVKKFNQKSFISVDPISIPHRFKKKQDIEIAGFFAAVFAWGQRPTILAKCFDLLNRMDNAPHDFMLNHADKDLIKLIDFKHRTFNDTDLLYFIAFFKNYYSKNKSLENAFTKGIKPDDINIANGLNNFKQLFFSLPDVPNRTKKHISSPAQKSACKRLNMYLRWMVRKDNNGVDFGLWKSINPALLICPLDIHVERVAKSLGLLTRDKTDWQAAVELTNNLKMFDPTDPVKYDFALYGLGLEEKYGNPF